MTTTAHRPLLAAMIAIERGAKQRAERQKTMHHRVLSGTLGQDSPLMGQERRYRPLREDDTELLPPVSQRVQVRGDQVLDEMGKTLADLFDIVGTREAGNATVTTDLSVGDVVIARDVPPGYLLFLEKQLNDLATVISKLPLLPPEEEWSWDDTTGTWRSVVRETHRTKKLPRAFEKAKATDKHPAQVEVVAEDLVVGIWSTVLYSGAFKADRVKQLLDRVEALRRAVKTAREECNSQEVDEFKTGQAIFNYLLAP